MIIAIAKCGGVWCSSLSEGKKPQGSVSSDAAADSRVGDSRSATAAIGGEIKILWPSILS